MYDLEVGNDMMYFGKVKLDHLRSRDEHSKR